MKTVKLVIAISSILVFGIGIILSLVSGLSGLCLSSEAPGTSVRQTKMNRGLLYAHHYSDYRSPL